MKRGLSLFVIFFSSIAGVLGAHALTYSIAYPNQRVRQFVLSHTGHPYWHLAPRAVVVGVIVAAIAALRLGFKTGPDAIGFAQVFKTLSVMQLVGFVGLEFIERLAAGVPIAQLFAPTLWIGIAMQLLIAAAASLVLLLLHRVAQVVQKLLRTTTELSERERHWLPTFERIPTRLLNQHARAQRAPPQLLLP